tara:strand:- start:60 stop:614 length:555 start_codon:yes stop_codon:yes gene_type:complete
MQQTEKIIVLIGLMGAGKTSVGRKLANLINMDFVDVDEEISKAAGCSVEDIFNKYGEDAFRDVEERVMARLLNEKTRVLATGGGAIMNPRTRKLVKACSISVWLNADIEVLVQRTNKRGDRPLLKNKDHGNILKKLLKERGPVYAEADICIDSSEDGPDVTAKNIMLALSELSPLQARFISNEK